MASNVTGIIDNTGIYVKTADLNIAKQCDSRIENMPNIFCLLNRPDSHLNVL